MVGGVRLVDFAHIAKPEGGHFGRLGHNVALVS